MREGETFMGLLDAGAEEPHSKALRYVVSGVALALLLGASLWYFLRYTTEKHTVDRFMHAVVAGDTQQAYQIWHPHPGFSYEDFLSFWGPNGYYSPIKTYCLESAEVPPKGGTGVVIVVEISAYDPFPKAEETIKSAQNREVQLWVERSDQSLSFPPP
jgi:hypothetical protein